MTASYVAFGSLTSSLGLSDTTGVASLFTGNIINLFLHGVLTVQLYLYYTSDFPQDPRILKTIVYLIYAADTVYTILLTICLGSFILGTSQHISASIYGVVIQVCGGTVTILTQATYAYRLRVLSRLKYVSWCILVLIVVNLVVATMLGPLMNLPAFLPDNKTSVYTGYRGVALQVWASISLAIDTTISGIKIWSLMKNKILSKQLRSKVTRLVYLIIGTGAPTAAANLAVVILLALGSPDVYGPAIIMYKFYANSMMVFLNDRILSGHGWGGQAISLDTATGPLGSVHFATAYGPADTAQERRASESCDNAGSSMPVQTGVEDGSKQHSVPA